MKTINKSTSTGSASPSGLPPLQKVCDLCYQALVRQLAAIRARIEREFRRTANGYEKLLHAAMNEAEALAWQTPYPHLFFPGLAEEKAAAVQHWVSRQRVVRRRGVWDSQVVR